MKEKQRERTQIGDMESIGKQAVNLCGATIDQQTGQHSSCPVNQHWTALQHLYLEFVYRGIAHCGDGLTLYLARFILHLP